MPLYITAANPICGKCSHLLFGGVRIKNRYFWACRNKNCEYAKEERPTAWETVTGERIIARRLDLTLARKALGPEMSKKHDLLSS